MILKAWPKDFFDLKTKNLSRSQDKDQNIPSKDQNHQKKF